MGYTIFYSWQSDTAARASRSFIRTALDTAVDILSAGAEVQDAPRVDSGMENVAGSPEVASVMFEKIREAAIMVVDVTLVGEITRSDGSYRRVPNPNVLLEMGFAAATLGWGRVIAVMNDHFGAPTEQPFDVRNRRFPITFTLDPSSMDRRDQQREALTSALKGALQTAIDADYRAAVTAASRLDINCYNYIRAFGQEQRVRSTDPQSIASVNGGKLDTQRLLAAETRLLDLGIIRAIISPKWGVTEYEWTFLGSQVLCYLDTSRSADRAGTTPTS
jgi:hypothetical protein